MVVLKSFFCFQSFWIRVLFNFENKVLILALDIPKLNNMQINSHWTNIKFSEVFLQIKKKLENCIWKLSKSHIN